MYQIGDRVRVRFPSDDCSWEGTVVAINGRWIHVKHDFGVPGQGLVKLAPPRYDYGSDELEHLNPVLKFVSEF